MKNLKQVLKKKKRSTIILHAQINECSITQLMIRVYVDILWNTKIEFYKEYGYKRFYIM